MSTTKETSKAYINEIFNIKLIYWIVIVGCFILLLIELLGEFPRLNKEINHEAEKILTEEYNKDNASNRQTLMEYIKKNFDEKKEELIDKNYEFPTGIQKFFFKLYATSSIFWFLWTLFFYFLLTRLVLSLLIVPFRNNQKLEELQSKLSDMENLIQERFNPL